MKSYVRPLFSTKSSLTVQTESIWSFEMCFSYDLLHLTYSESTAQVNCWQAQGLPWAWGVGGKGEFFSGISANHTMTQSLEWNSLLNTRSSPDCLYGTNLDLRWKTTFQRKILEPIKGFPLLGPGPWESCKGLQGPGVGGTVWGLSPLGHLFVSCPKRRV